MSHPTRSELFEFIDGRLEKKRAEEITLHLSECAQCRREAELERSTKAVVQSAPLDKVREGFSASVMVNLAAPAGDPFILKLLGKLGSVVAMIVVLAVIGLAVVHESDTTDQPERTPSAITQFVTPISDLYAMGLDRFAARTATISRAIENAGSPQFWQVLFFIGLTAGVLIVADRIFGKRFLRLHL